MKFCSVSLSIVLICLISGTPSSHAQSCADLVARLSIPFVAAPTTPTLTSKIRDLLTLAKDALLAKNDMDKEYDRVKRHFVNAKVYEALLIEIQNGEYLGTEALLKELMQGGPKLDLDLPEGEMVAKREWLRKVLEGDRSYIRRFITKNGNADELLRYLSEEGAALVRTLLARHHERLQSWPKLEKVIEVITADVRSGGFKAGFWIKKLDFNFPSLQHPQNWERLLRKTILQSVDIELWREYEARLASTSTTSGFESFRDELTLEQRRADFEETRRRARAQQEQPTKQSLFSSILGTTLTIQKDRDVQAASQAQKLREALPEFLEKRALSLLLIPLRDRLNAKDLLIEALKDYPTFVEWLNAHKDHHDLAIKLWEDIHTYTAQLEAAKWSREEAEALIRQAEESSNSLELEMRSGLFFRHTDRIPHTVEAKRAILADLRAGKKAALYWLQFFKVDREFWLDLALCQVAISEEAGGLTSITARDWLNYRRETEEGFPSVPRDLFTTPYHVETPAQVPITEPTTAKPAGLKVEQLLPFDQFLSELTNTQAKKLIESRIKRAREDANLGQFKHTEKGVLEMVIDNGPGYRIYFVIRGPKEVVILFGGLKDTQEADLRKAAEIYSAYLAASK